MAVRMLFAMTSTELVVLLRSDPQLEVEFSGHGDLEVGFRSQSDRESNFEYRGKLLPVAGGCELRADFASPKPFLLIACVWIGVSLLVFAQMLRLALSDSPPEHALRRVIIGAAFVLSGPLIFGFAWLTGSSQETALRKRIEDLTRGRLLTSPSTSAKSV